MAADSREKFATQVNSRTLAAVRRIAEKEGRQLQSIVEEALTDLLEKRRLGKPRSHVMSAYQETVPVTDYLTFADVIAIHADLIERYGGSQGLRDAGLLEAALFRPQTGYYADLIEEAAALWESLVVNHPFVDGNKRIAFAAMDVFLRINGYKLRIDSSEAYRAIMAMLQKRSLGIDDIREWLRGIVR